MTIYHVQNVINAKKLNSLLLPKLIFINSIITSCKISEKWFLFFASQMAALYDHVSPNRIKVFNKYTRTVLHYKHEGSD